MRLLLDCGAESIVVNAKVARSMGVSTRPGFNLVGLGTKSARTGAADSVDVGPLSYGSCLISVVDGEVAEGNDGVIPLAEPRSRSG